MNRIAKFYKVSYSQFQKDWLKTFDNCNNCQEIYDQIKLPTRATLGSAGYDFFMPTTMVIEPNQTILVPTGIRVEIDNGWVLNIYPRSSLGFKYQLKLDNTVGIIDSDYFGATNEGHIFVKLTNCSSQNKTLTLDNASAFVQGVFLPFGITVDDECNSNRVGGIGSTNTN